MLPTVIGLRGVALFEPFFDFFAFGVTLVIGFKVSLFRRAFGTAFSFEGKAGPFPPDPGNTATRRAPAHGQADHSTGNAQSAAE